MLVPIDEEVRGNICMSVGWQEQKLRLPREDQKSLKGEFFLEWEGNGLLG